jgi:hypothetical protein
MMETARTYRLPTAGEILEALADLDWEATTVTATEARERAAHFFLENSTPAGRQHGGDKLERAAKLLRNL